MYVFDMILGERNGDTAMLVLICTGISGLGDC